MGARQDIIVESSRAIRNQHKKKIRLSKKVDNIGRKPWFGNVFFFCACCTVGHDIYSNPTFGVIASIFVTLMLGGYIALKVNGNG